MKVIAQAATGRADIFRAKPTSYGIFKTKATNLARSLNIDGRRLVQIGSQSPQLMANMQKKTLSDPDEKRLFDKGQVDLVALGGVTFGRATLQPGWRWSTCVKPIVGTESCQAPHLQYHVSGHLRVRMDDGSEDEFGPGDVSLLPPGHDAWVVGAEPVVVIDITGMVNYAKPG